MYHLWLLLLSNWVWDLTATELSCQMDVLMVVEFTGTGTALVVIVMELISCGIVDDLRDFSMAVIELPSLFLTAS